MLLCPAPATTMSKRSSWSACALKENGAAARGASAVVFTNSRRLTLLMNTLPSKQSFDGPLGSHFSLKPGLANKNRDRKYAVRAIAKATSLVRASLPPNRLGTPPPAPPSFTRHSNAHVDVSIRTDAFVGPARVHSRMSPERPRNESDEQFRNRPCRTLRLPRPIAPNLLRLKQFVRVNLADQKEVRHACPALRGALGHKPRQLAGSLESRGHGSRHGSRNSRFRIRKLLYVLGGNHSIGSRATHERKIHSQFFRETPRFR